MSAPAEKAAAYVPSLSDEQAFRRRRNHAQIEAMTGLILQQVGYPTRRHRDFICALQSTNSGNDARVPYTPFRRAHLTLADYMRLDGPAETRRKAVYREIVTLRRFQKRTGVMLFHVTPGSEEEATEYVDYLTPAADAAVQRCLSSPLWQTDKQAAKREAVEWAVSQLPRIDVEDEPEPGSKELPLTEYESDAERRIRGAIERAALEIERRGGDPEPWARSLMRGLQQDLESRKKTAPARLDYSSLAGLDDEDEGGHTAAAIDEGSHTSDGDSVLPFSGVETVPVEQGGEDGSVLPPPENPGNFELFSLSEPSLFTEEDGGEPPPQLTALEAALAYARLGWPVFPLHHPDLHRGCSCMEAKACRSPGKHPRTRKGLKDASTDEAQIRRWWEIYPLAGVGLAMGRKSGLVAVDVDPRSGGDASISELIEVYGELPETLEAATGGGGSHIFFAHPGVVFKNSSSALGEGLDVKTDGGYVVAAPSLHASGKRYQWRNRLRPADVPSWLLKLLTAEKERHSAPTASTPRHQSVITSHHGSVITDGSRNNRLFRVACAMRGNGSGQVEIEAELLEVNAFRCRPPLDPDELRKIAVSATRYPAGR
jgi:hypothetical protein